MIRLILSLTFCLLLSGKALSSYPTPQGLFRFGSDIDFSSDLILLDLKIQQIEIESDKNQSNLIHHNAPVSDEHIIGEKYVQLIFAPGERRTSMLQVEFGREGFDENDAIRSQYFPNLARKLREDYIVSRSLFYSLMTKYSFNSDQFITDLLLRRVPGFKSNQELINREKQALLQKYKEYLKMIKEDEALVDDLISPLRPEDPELRKAVDEIMKAPFYKRDENTILTKEGRKFFWQLEYENFNAYFSADHQRLKSLYFQMTEYPIRVRVNEYVLFDGRKTLPKMLYLQNSRGELFKIEILNYRRLSNRGSRIDSMARDYSERLGRDAMEDPTFDLIY